MVGIDGWKGGKMERLVKALMSEVFTWNFDAQLLPSLPVSNSTTIWSTLHRGIRMTLLKIKLSLSLPNAKAFEDFPII